MIIIFLTFDKTRFCSKDFLQYESEMVYYYGKEKWKISLIVLDH